MPGSRQGAVPSKWRTTHWKPVDRDEHGRGDHPQRVFQGDELRPLMLDATGGEGAEPRSIEGRHRGVPWGSSQFKNRRSCFRTGGFQESNCPQEARDRQALRRALGLIAGSIKIRVR